ncbi:hypothetical protein I4U23_023326 [Adineta vaga]|nr:hypothetical protein I4U23_023326 [Adineta vaga]
MSITPIEQSLSGFRFYINHRQNLIQTAFLVVTWIILGFHLELIGPTMSNIAANIRVDFSGIGSILAARATGYLIANIFGVILQNIVKKYSEGLLICAFMLSAIVVFATPFVTSLILMYVLFFIQGIAQSLTDLGGMNILLTMWNDKAAAPLNMTQLGYGIGAILVNLLVRSFLVDKSSSINITAMIIPYSITAALCFLVAIGHALFYIRKLRNPREQTEGGQFDYNTLNNHGETVREIVSPYSPRTFGNGDFQYGLILSILFICYIFFVSGDDQTFSRFFFSYLKSEQFHLSNSVASRDVILYWLSYSIGRLIGAILSIWFSVNMCLNFIWFGGLCLAIAWLIVVWTIGLTSTTLFILGAATGFVFAPLFPLSLSLINQRLNVVPVLLALLLCGAGLGAIAFQKLAGIIMDKNPNHFPTLLIVCILISIVLYIISNAISYFYQRKNRSSLIHGVVLPLEVFNEDEQQ